MTRPLATAGAQPKFFETPRSSRIDAITAAVIGGTSLFGGRGEVRDALFGSLVIATIANGLNTLNLSQGDIYIVTGAILLFAVTLDTILRRRQMKAGR